MADQIRLRRDNESDWDATPTAALKSGEVGLIHDDTTGVFLGRLRIGTMVPGNIEAPTLFSSLPDWYLMDGADREKLTLLEVVTGEIVVDLINAYLQTDLATAINEAGLDYNGIATILDTGPDGTQWRERGAVSIYGNPMDLDGDLTIPLGSLGITDIDDLQLTLDGKSDVGHGHATAQITGLDAALAAKVPNSALGVTVATLGEDFKLTPEQVPDALASPVVSVFGRIDAVIAETGDYSAAHITNIPAGDISATSVQDAINELGAEKQALALRGVANGYCDLNSSGFIPTARLSPADAAYEFTTTIAWMDNTATNADAPAAETALSSQGRAMQANLLFASSVTPSVYIGGTAFPTNGGFRFKYATAADGYVTYTTLCEVIADNALGVSIQRYGTPVAIPAGAQTDATRIRVYTFGGDGATDPIYGQLNLTIDHSVPINTGTVTGAAMVSAIDAELSGTAWRDAGAALADASVALAKIVNFSTQTAPLRKSAGTGSLEAGTQADWRTFLNVTNSFNGRTGTVSPASNDYTADLIAATATRGWVTPENVSKLTRMLTQTEFTTSSVVGLVESSVVFSGAGTTVLTGTLSNNDIADFIWVYNIRTVNINVVPQSPRTMANSTGGALTTTAVAPGAAVCARRIGNVFRILT